MLKPSRSLSLYTKRSNQLSQAMQPETITLVQVDSYIAMNPFKVRKTSNRYQFHKPSGNLPKISKILEADEQLFRNSVSFAHHDLQNPEKELMNQLRRNHLRELDFKKGKKQLRGKRVEKNTYQAMNQQVVRWSQHKEEKRKLKDIYGDGY